MDHIQLNKTLNILKDINIDPRKYEIKESKLPQIKILVAVNWCIDTVLLQSYK